MIRLDHHALPLALIVIGLLRKNVAIAFSPIIRAKTRSPHTHATPLATVLQAGASPLGRVEDIDEWMQWTSDSLQRFSENSNETLFQFMNVKTLEEIHDHERYAVLSHGVQDDPIFCYSNVAARTTFQYAEDEFYQLCSRYSAPEGGGERKDRQQIMNDVDNDNFWIIPSGIRQRKDGSLFEFRDVILWNVYHPVTGTRVGQSAVYDRDKVIDLPAPAEDDGDVA